MLILSTFYYYNAIVQNHLLKIKKKFIIVYSCVIISIERVKMQNNDEAKNILDYWKALEMLIPNAFPVLKTEYSKESKYNLICNRISSDCSIKNIIDNDNKKYYLHSEICGDIEICYGKFERGVRSVGLWTTASKREGETEEQSLLCVCWHF